MSNSAVATFVPLVGLNNFCTILDAGVVKYALSTYDGYLAVNTQGDNNIPSAIATQPAGRVGSLQTAFLVFASGFEGGEGTNFMQFAVNNPPGSSLGLQNPTQTAYGTGSYDPSLFYPMCSVQNVETNYVSNSSDVTPFNALTRVDASSIGVGPYTIGPVRAFNQNMAVNLVGLGNVGQNGCTLVQLGVPADATDMLLQVTIDFSWTAGN